jgi:hypothetical protein
MSSSRQQAIYNKMQSTLHSTILKISLVSPIFSEHAFLRQAHMYATITLKSGQL